MSETARLASPEGEDPMSDTIAAERMVEALLFAATCTSSTPRPA